MGELFSRGATLAPGRDAGSVEFVFGFGELAL